LPHHPDALPPVISVCPFLGVKRTLVQTCVNVRF
jgi:hypothetical protein